LRDVCLFFCHFDFIFWRSFDGFLWDFVAGRCFGETLKLNWGFENEADMVRMLAFLRGL
jgi:hypothetical protein